MRLVTPDGATFELSFGETSIGRDPENKVTVTEPLVSRRHAEVQYDGWQCFITDLDSTNGTMLNAVRLQPHRRHLLRPGDMLTLADKVSFVVQESVPEGPPPSKAAVQPVAGRPTRLIAALIGVILVLLVGLAALSLLYARRKEIVAVESPLPASITPTATPTVPLPTWTSTAIHSTPTFAVTPLPPTSTPTPLPDAVVNIGQLNVRAGPGTVYAITGKVHEGDTLEVTGKADNCQWLRVITAQGKTGWVSGLEKYVTLNLCCARILAAPIPPRPTSTPKPTVRPTPDTRPTVQIPVQNDTDETLHLTLDGLAQYRFTIAAGRHHIAVVPGSYSYTGRGCGGATKSGTYNLSSSTDEWRWWCGTW